MKKLAQKMYIGMDVSDRMITICEMIGEKKRILEIPNLWKHIVEYFKQFTSPETITVAFETGTHSNWHHDLITGMGFKVIVGNATKLSFIFKNNRKCDEVDAEMLARISRFDPQLLHPVKVKEPEYRLDIAILKARDILVRSRTTLTNSLRGMLKSFGIKVSSLDISTANFGARIMAFIPKELKKAFSGLVRQVKALTAEIKQYDKLIIKLCQKYPATERLRQVHGVGPLTSLAFILVIGDPNRFNDGKSIGNYLGLCPRRDQSGEVDKQLPISKAGDKMLRGYLVEAASYIMGPLGKDCQLRSFGLRKASQGSHAKKKKARIAVARKLGVLLWALWKNEEDYIPMGKGKKAVS